MGEFGARVDELIKQVGTGNLEGKVTVDQVYAQYQHEDLSLRHPGGGQAKYLEKPLMQDHPKYLQRIASEVLDRGPEPAMERAMEDLSQSVYDLAPIEFGDLKASGHPTVDDDGRTVYDRPPMMRRLTEEEIDIKRGLREIGLGNA